RRPGRAAALRDDARAHDPVLGHIGVHRGGLRARHPAPAREPAVHARRPHLGPDPVGPGLRRAHQPARRGDERDRRGMLVLDRGAVDAGPVVLILLFPPLKTQRPPDLASRRVEWSQFCVFAAVYAMIAALGLERTEPLVLAALLFAASLFYAVVYARNWDFALAVLAVAL